MTRDQDPPQDQPDDTMLDSEPISSSIPAAEEPPAGPSALLAPETLALDNARGGRWAMNEYFDGLVWLGSDNKLVMRNDRSRIGFYFRDAARLASELAGGSGAEHAADPRRGLAPLDTGFNADWDPQVQKSYLATMTKMTRLMAYDYVGTTEPEEAVRKAVAIIFGNPRHIDEPRMKVWVPGKYDVEAVKSVANALVRQTVGDMTEREDIDNAWRYKGEKLRRSREIGASGARLNQASPQSLAEREEIDDAMRRKGEKLRRGRETGGGSALAEASLQVIGGLRDGLQEALKLLDDTANDLNDWMPLTLIETEKPLSEMFALPEVAKPKTASGAAVRAVSQFVVGFVPALQALRSAKVASLVGHRLEQATASSLASAVVLDPLETRVANLIEEFPALRNPVTEYLAAKPGDSKAEGRLKNAIEGFALGFWGEGLLRALHAVHAWQHFKEEHAHEGVHQPAGTGDSQPDNHGE